MARAGRLSGVVAAVAVVVAAAAVGAAVATSAAAAAVAGAKAPGGAGSYAKQVWQGGNVAGRVGGGQALCGRRGERGKGKQIESGVGGGGGAAAVDDAVPTRPR